MKRPAFWILLGLASLAAGVFSFLYFPYAFSIVSLDITMDRDRALADARAIMARDGRGPADYRQAAAFELDSEAQTFVELEGGGKEAFTRMLADGLYAAYTWRVRQFREGETHETRIRFTPDGRPYGFVERLKEDAPGAALDAGAAREIAEAGARRGWTVDLDAFALVEQGQERRPGGRVDHTFTYERPSPTLNEGRYRLRLVVSGDRLTEVTYFIRIPEAFSRRYESMRSANQAIGIGSAVGMMLLYVVGGIGVGLFVLLRKRWVLWRPAAAWGVFIALLQTMATLNAWPLQWMAYDTALPRSTFIVQQIAVAGAIFVGFSAFFALSFMAAEGLTRRAFGPHPQFWRLWAKEPGSSTAVLGRTISGYLLVPIFLAYEVALYFLATRTFGWWTPSEALLHPDVLATYVPWLSAIANSLQAGFWEECLFRAIPIAGAALIGDRFGRRRLFIVIAFVLQAVIFGAGHAPYPAQPSYARPVELLLPSIGFGLLYLYYGLLPAIVLHFAFDVVWFALPIFVATAPGIWFQQAMVVLLTLVPVWVVLWRRAQMRRWTALSPADLNAAWTPAPAETERAPAAAAQPRYALRGRVRQAWLGLGAAGLVFCVVAVLAGGQAGSLNVTRQEAVGAARRALEDRGVTVDSRWRMLAVPQSGGGAQHEFVADTAGDDRRRELIGTYLSRPHWRVRVATFEGDLAERAEEWEVLVGDAGEVRTIRHRLPQGRPGASLDEDAARRLAHDAVLRRTGLDAGRGDVREVSARPAKLEARTDWTFTFTDAVLPPLPQGEPRMVVGIAGDEVASTGLFVHVPEDWQRRQRAVASRVGILQIAVGMIFGGLLVAAAIGGVVTWSRGRYTPRLFLAAAAIVLGASFANTANGWPALLASLSTAQPLALQVAALGGAALIGLTVTAVLVGLAIGALPHRLAGSGTLPGADALRLGVAAGFFGAALQAGARWLRTPAWARTPDVSPLGSVVPPLDLALDPVVAFLTVTAILLTVMAASDRLTLGWTRHRAQAGAAIALVGFLSAGMPVGTHVAGWIAAGLLMSAGLLAAYVTLLRADLTMVPIALGTAGAVAALGQGLQRPFPGALAGSFAAALVIALVSWWCFEALRRARTRAIATTTGPTAVSA